MKALVILILLVVVLGVVTLGATRARWEGEPPQIMFNRDFKALGRTPAVDVTIQDPGTGLKHVSIHLKQKDQDVVLADDALVKEKTKKYDVGKLIADKYKVEDGPATLSITASDNSLRNFFAGNRTDVTKDFTFNVKPPQLEVLEGQHYINQGGSECVVYRVSGNAEIIGRAGRIALLSRYSSARTTIYISLSSHWNMTGLRIRR